VCQAFKGAATRQNASRFVKYLACAGVKILITWEQGDEREYQMVYDRRRYPVPPATEEFFATDANSEENQRNIGVFEQTGQSPCLWQPRQVQAG